MQLGILPGSRALQLHIHLADAPGSIQQRHHDRVAVTIETVI
jgi:hypothetical protein